MEQSIQLGEFILKYLRDQALNREQMIACAFDKESPHICLVK